MRGAGTPDGGAGRESGGDRRPNAGRALDAGAPLVLVGPSGAGKTTIAERLVSTCRDRFVLSVSVTTRPPRAGERNGREYRFVSRSEFEAMIDGGRLAEWARVHGRCYGTPLDNLATAGRGGRRPVLDIDLQGARQVAERVPGAVQVFVAPPGPKQWIRRLAGRGTETSAEVVRRLRTALTELEAVPSFERVVVNREVDQAVAEALAFAEPAARDGVSASASSESVAALCRRLRAGAQAEIDRLRSATDADSVLGAPGLDPGRGAG